MDSFNLNKISGSSGIKQNSSGRQLSAEELNTENKIVSENVTKPNIELDDFFEYLNPKVVEKILQTPEEARTRIVKDIQQYEYDVNGAENIFNSLG